MMKFFLIFGLLVLRQPSFCQQNAVELIPLPQKVQWSEKPFKISTVGTIFIKDKSLADVVRRFISPEFKNWTMEFSEAPASSKKYVYISLNQVDVPLFSDEAYHLKVTQNTIGLYANTPHGIFNGLQTLAQLINGNKVKGCVITDYPAFSWRGYMVDVGRNFQSVAQLKQQIDVMARYKLNIFHFHLTENEAWRLQIKKYPQLTDAKNMTRNKGDFYTVEQVKELIRYCKERYITLVPEIDMPGHSEAFTRAMGFDMQSEQGLEAIKNMLKEVSTTYDVPYLHIGADEVKITNERFIPEVEALISSLGKTEIAWNPGESKSDKTIQQLWKGEDRHYEQDTTGRYIDSRFLYFSDMDPQNTVVTIFNRKFFEKDHGNKSLLGAEICLWNDRRMGSQEILLRQNAVYPAIVTFAERSWRGGGYDGVNYYIGAKGSEKAQQFEDFEKRLLHHKSKYFKSLPFTYVKQTHIKWKLLGPFENKGNLEQQFWPETQRDIPPDSSGIAATGGTIWLWHTHFPVTSAWLPHPQKQTTWYAYTKFWSNTAGIVSFWVDTKDQSKSGADATPPKGEWDYNKSKVWINHSIIDPPVWQHPGRASGKLEEPLVDEMYYLRDPVKVKLKKGWNTILVKLPVDQFDPLKDWQEPPKLMFTVIPVQQQPGSVNWDAIEFQYEPD
ncbi:MAG: family 20 glycosylhydrolase [Niabella sp.]